VRAIAEARARLGDTFDLSRRLAHRMGLASWAGPGSAEGDAFNRLVRAFDVLDGAEAFVHPDAMAAVAASGKRAERAALDEVVDVVGAAIDRAADRADDQSLFARIVDAWSSERPTARIRGIGLDVALIHVASMSNLAAALGWALVDLLEHAEYVARIRAAEDDLARASVIEHFGRAQLGAVGSGSMDRSPVTGHGCVALTDAGHRVRARAALVPAQPFSLAAMTTALTRLLGHYRMTPRWTAHPLPVPAQIGGVARAAGPCPVDYVTHR
jgi:hypothetical protein